jgi:hypothetical protein
LLTSCHIDEILTRCLVYFNVTITNVVLMPLECHIAVFLVDESDKSFTVPATLGT